MSDSEDVNVADTTAIIEAFGGIRPMAQKLGVPVSTVQGWKQRDAFPENRTADILAAAATHGVDLAGIGAASGAVEETSAAGPGPAAPPPAAGSPAAGSRAAGSSATAPPATGSVPASGPKPQKKSGDGGLKNGGLKKDRGALVIAVIALMVATGVGGWTLWGGGGQTVVTAPGGDLAEISNRLRALEAATKNGASATAQRQFSADIADLRAEIDGIARAQTEISAPTAQTGELDTRLQAAETRLDQVQRQTASETQAAAAALSVAQGEIVQLRQQLAALAETRSDAQNITEAVGLALTTARLQRAVDNGAPYQDVLVTLRALSAGDAAIGAILDRLAEQADAGIPTRDVLTQTFSGVARDVVAAANAEAADGWTDRTLQRIRSVASVRRIGADVPGDAPDARVARAEAKLLGGDLGGAVAELDALAGAAASAAATWLDGARARVAADLAAGQIEALAIARLQAGGGGS